MSFDIDDDVRRDEFDELHGIDREWFDTDPTPAEGIERPLFEAVGLVHVDAEGVLS